MRATQKASIQAGELFHRVTLQAVINTRDDYGQIVPTWTDGATYWGRIMPFRARDVMIAGQVEGLSTHTITLRYLGQGVTLSAANNRFRMGSRIFEMVGAAINVGEENHEFEIPVVEVHH